MKDLEQDTTTLRIGFCYWRTALLIAGGCDEIMCVKAARVWPEPPERGPLLLAEHKPD